jgi:ABC-type antimicrobial peptide transport system permease subunit
MKKLLLKNQSKKQVAIALFGLFLGYLLLALSVHFFIQINSSNEKTSVLGNDILLVQRKISNFSTLSIVNPNFSSSDIVKLKGTAGIASIQPVINNSFPVSFETNDQLVPYFRSDIFLQSVPEEFLEIEKSHWNWSKYDKTVPIALPRDFVLMLNTFMLAQNMPQLSDEIIKDVKFKFTIGEGKQKEWFDAKIEGFSNEFNAILIPESFMKYCNEKHGDVKKLKTNQLIVKGISGEFGKLSAAFESKGLEAKSNQMVTARLKSILEKTILITAVISLITLLLSGLIMVQFLQLLLSRSSYEIKTLYLLGYSRNSIRKIFFKYFISLFGIMGIVSLITFLLLKPFVENFIVSSGFPLEISFSILPYFTVILAFTLFVLASFLTASRELKLLAN